jgi:hypothetical protein
MGVALPCAPNKCFSSASWDLAHISFAFNCYVRVAIALVNIATVSRSAEVAVAKLAMAVTKPLLAGRGVGS